MKQIVSLPISRSSIPHKDYETGIAGASSSVREVTFKTEANKTMRIGGISEQVVRQAELHRTIGGRAWETSTGREANQGTSGRSDERVACLNSSDTGTCVHVHVLLSC
jgi:hypothetical protein